MRRQGSQGEGRKEAYFRSDSPESVNSKGSSGYTNQRTGPACHRSPTKRSAGYKRHITAEAAAGSSPHGLRVGIEGDEEGSPTPLLFLSVRWSLDAGTRYGGLLGTGVIGKWVQKFAAGILLGSSERIDPEPSDQTSRQLVFWCSPQHLTGAESLRSLCGYWSCTPLSASAWLHLAPQPFPSHLCQMPMQSRQRLLDQRR